ncbi:MAG: hypothetical protein ACI9XK_002254, partial [Granulosicoccus sp.]
SILLIGLTRLDGLNYFSSTSTSAGTANGITDGANAPRLL